MNEASLWLSQFVLHFLFILFGEGPEINKKNFKMVLKQETSSLSLLLKFVLNWQDLDRIIFLISKTHRDKQNIIKKAGKKSSFCWQYPVVVSQQNQVSSKNGTCFIKINDAFNLNKISHCKNRTNIIQVEKDYFSRKKKIQDSNVLSYWIKRNLTIISDLTEWSYWKPLPLRRPWAE